MPVLNKSDIIGRTFLMPPQEYGQKSRVLFFEGNISQLTIIQCSDALCYLAVRICNDIHPSLSSSTRALRRHRRHDDRRPRSSRHTRRCMPCCPSSAAPLPPPRRTDPSPRDCPPKPAESILLKLTTTIK